MGESRTDVVDLVERINVPVGEVDLLLVFVRACLEWHLGSAVAWM